ncbi:MAG TPA: hypothetical protein DHU63_10510 [Candidatus Marinimicrobia bacterium]|nr:MAG: hypothetical protein AUJ47_04815 [Candidatus Marinimicrobia bacterium CG1_02_48_14]HCW76952.1 hypothetical protein [Candidatus Neomarinimicrobiota bacterium]
MSRKKLADDKIEGTEVKNGDRFGRFFPQQGINFSEDTDASTGWEFPVFLKKAAECGNEF